MEFVDFGVWNLVVGGCGLGFGLLRLGCIGWGLVELSF